MPGTPTDGGGYACAQCGQWVHWNSTHICQPVQIPNAWPPAPASLPAQQWDFSYKPTQREYFAARAMQGLLANLAELRREGFKDCEIEQFAVMRADALIAALASKSTGDE